MFAAESSEGQLGARLVSEGEKITPMGIAKEWVTHVGTMGTLMYTSDHTQITSGVRQGTHTKFKL